LGIEAHDYRLLDFSYEIQNFHRKLAPQGAIPPIVMGELKKIFNSLGNFFHFGRLAEQRARVKSKISY